MDVEAKLKEIFMDVVDVTEAELVPEVELRSGLATSVDIVEIVASIENEFDLDLSDEEIAQIRTFGETVDYVKSKLG